MNINDYASVMVINTSQEAPESRPGRRWYNWSIHIETNPENVIEGIKKVIYHLHPSFRDKEVPIDNSASGFKLDGKGWGEFTITLDLLSNTGKTVTLAHDLTLRGRGESIHKVPIDLLI
jgi:transcription initiation factor IIF auxiliary subunit